jgi:hypothetical protein
LIRAVVRVGLEKESTILRAAVRFVGNGEEVQEG